MTNQPTIAILMGSKTDLPAVQPAADTLRELGIPHEVRVMSAHRTPDQVAEYVRGAPVAGIKVFIAAAGGAAHLAGAVAAHTILPVIGIPVASSKLAGLDALLATVQMPPGVPVATVAVDGAQNAALLAAAILAVGDETLAKRLSARRADMARKTQAADDEVRRG
jgi:phosphoribosylaminoimidazole carboxylase PurE protein